MDYKQSAAEIAANKATFVASGASIFLGLTANEIAALGGLVVALLALIINAVMNWHFKSQHLKIARAKALADGAEIDDDAM
ncbi:hypothetical protein PTW32_10925 [Dechloromonas agitata]|uniref:hypothetical protein n=1 Tax=Dechloromonas agitata TaxID=73030 RepID=UPI00237DD423|nr:hypothetical protein [Dechloromonas agitata]MDE1545933.1 hypothetical protein [Dechloromonas agitata]